MAEKKQDVKMKDLKIELLKQNSKRREIRREIARMLTKKDKEEKKR